MTWRDIELELLRALSDLEANVNARAVEVGIADVSSQVGSAPNEFFPLSVYLSLWRSSDASREGVAVCVSCHYEGDRVVCMAYAAQEDGPMLAGGPEINIGRAEIESNL